VEKPTSNHELTTVLPIFDQTRPNKNASVSPASTLSGTRTKNTPVQALVVDGEIGQNHPNAKKIYQTNPRPPVVLESTQPQETCHSCVQAALSYPPSR